MQVKESGRTIVSGQEQVAAYFQRAAEASTRVWLEGSGGTVLLATVAGANSEGIELTCDTDALPSSMSGMKELNGKIDSGTSKLEFETVLATSYELGDGRTGLFVGLPEKVVSGDLRQHSRYKVPTGMWLSAEVETFGGASKASVADVSNQGLLIALFRPEKVQIRPLDRVNITVVHGQNSMNMDAEIRWQREQWLGVFLPTVANDAGSEQATFWQTIVDSVSSAIAMSKSA